MSDLNKLIKAIKLRDVNQVRTILDEHGELVMSGIHTYGDVVHLFIERENYRGTFMPGFRKWESAYNPPQTGLQYVDHCVGNVVGVG